MIWIEWIKQQTTTKQQKQIEIKAYDKKGKLEERIIILEGQISSANDTLKDLEEKEGTSSFQEEAMAVELAVLEGELKEFEVQYESKERSCNVLQRNIDETKQEIKSWKDKKQEIEDEMASMNENWLLEI